MARPVRTEPFAYNERGQPICGARTRGGGQCDQTRISPTSFRCRMHGGTTPRGIANVNTRSGMYSQDLPTRLLARYEEVLTDPALLSVRNDVAVLQADIKDRFARIKQGETQPDYERILAMTEKIVAECKTWDWTRIDAELAALKDAISGEAAQDRAMWDIRRLMQERAALVAQENRLLQDKERSVPADQVMLLIRALTTAVRRIVNDPDMLTEIDAEFRRITGRA